MKKVLKGIALAVAVALILGIGWFANALVGNPVSQWLAENAAEAWLAENHADTDYYILDVGFNFKDTNYYAHVRSETSRDTQFTLYINMVGKVYRDTYESVTRGFVTARRLDSEYRELTDRVLEDPNFPYESDIGYGTLEIYPREALEDVTVPDYAIMQEDLVLDKVYDIRELGARAGRLVVYVYREELTPEAAAEVLLGIRRAFDGAGIPFRAIDLTLRHPKTEDGPWDEEFVGVEGFLYSEITEEGLADKVAEADRALKESYAQQDALRK